MEMFKLNTEIGVILMKSASPDPELEHRYKHCSNKEIKRSLLNCFSVTNKTTNLIINQTVDRLQAVLLSSPSGLSPGNHIWWNLLCISAVKWNLTGCDGKCSLPHSVQTAEVWKCVFLPCIVLMHSKPWKSHSLIVMSAEQEAKSLPVWSKEMSCTESVWPFNVRSKSPVS